MIAGVIVVGKYGQTRAVALGRWTRALLSLCMVGLPLESMAMSHGIGEQNSTGEQWVGVLRERLREARSDLDDADVNQQAQARRAELQARIHLAALIRAGNLFKPGQVAALTGDTCHAAAPQPRLEVYKYGRVIDPSSYCRNTSR
jgi:hypothetical protein